MIHIVGKLSVIFILTVAIIWGQEQAESVDRLRLVNADLAKGRKIGDRNIRILEGNVEFRQGDAYIKCQRCVEYQDEGRYDFEDDVEIFNNGKWIYADRVIYYENPPIEEAEGHVRLVDSTKTLLSRKLRYLEQEETAFADDSVRILDEHNRLTLTGNHVEYRRTEGYAKITGSPILSKKDSTDTIELTISGQLMEMFDDGARVVVKDSVVIERGVVTATCGEVEYLDEEEKVILRKQPKAKRKWDDLWGEEITLLLKDTKVNSININGQGLVTSKVDTLNPEDSRYNFTSGEKITVWVHDEVMDSVQITGRATSYYHVVEDEQDKGINKVLGDEMRLYFSDGELKRVRVPSSPGSTTGTFFPPAQSYLVDSELNDLLIKRPDFKEHGINKAEAIKPFLNEN